MHTPQAQAPAPRPVPIGPRQRWIAALCLAALALACARGARDSGAIASVPVELRGTLEPLRDHFNSHLDLPRAVLLLSPT
jgi:hypothetical protein